MTACTCNEVKRPLASDLPEGSNERPRQWFVTRRNESRSAFNGYKATWSNYSDVSCRVCGCYWRTCASYVSALRDCEFWPQHAPKAEPMP